MTNTPNYIVATIKPWNIAAYERSCKKLPGQWHLMTDQAQLNDDVLKELNPRYIFFPHWSWQVPDNISRDYECVCFHMTDVPYGRGGSPLQNLVLRKYKTTKLSALRMVSELDAGPVYIKRDLDLSGSAQAIFERAAETIYAMIASIVSTEPQPEPQEGAPVVFARRTPEMSVMPLEGDVATIYDHIRMLDADTYPRAFIKQGDFKLSFSDAKLDESGKLTAQVSISLSKEEGAS